MIISNHTEKMKFHKDKRPVAKPKWVWEWAKSREKKFERKSNNQFIHIYENEPQKNHDKQFNLVFVCVYGKVIVINKTKQQQQNKQKRYIN